MANSSVTEVGSVGYNAGAEIADVLYGSAWIFVEGTGNMCPVLCDVTVCR